MSDNELLEKVVIALCSSADALKMTDQHIVRMAKGVVERTRRVQMDLAGMNFANPNRHQEI